MLDSVSISQMLPSMETLLPESANPDPAIVIKVPPPVPPLSGDADDIVGVMAAS